MQRLVRSQFPSVAQLKTSELDSWLADASRIQPLLLDVRTAEEYAVSHLPGAVRVEPAARVDEVLATTYSEQPIVVYCSVGYRSSEFAQRLQHGGRTSVVNLEGSIFAWVNEGRALQVDNSTTDRVHPYNAIFGLLVSKKHRAQR